ncbi:putative porin, partial [Leeuwenhoekiella blandensis]
MRYFVLFFFLIATSLSLQAQDARFNRDGVMRDTLDKQRSARPPKREKQERPAIDLYKIISVENDTTVVDTSLTVEKLYKYNYLRKDNFELLPFSNEGQTYNTLAYDFSAQNIRPVFGARARHFNYMEVADINYYQVPTPLTELYYKSVFSQGQNLDAFFTMNKSKRFNFSIAYKGLRSLGKYQNFLTSTGNFRFTLNYQTKNKRYDLKAHYVAQDLMNQQNGGLTDQALLNFASGNSQFNDRARLSVNFEDAEN